MRPMVAKPFQRAAIDKVFASAMAGRTPLLVSPSGSGKTLMNAELCLSALASGAKRCLVFAHRKEIIDQTQRTLIQQGLSPEDIGILRSKQRERLNARVLITSIGSLVRHPSTAAGVEFCVGDEAHHIMARTYLQVRQRLRNARLAGATATPVRMDGKGLGDVFGEMFVAALPTELIAQGFLGEPAVFRAPEEFLPDLTDVRVAGGEYASEDLETRVNRRELVGGLVDNYRRRADGKRAIAFAVSCTHSRKIADAFTDAGIAAAHIDGDMDEKERVDILSRFERGQIRVISNCYVLSEGYDLPACEAVIMARPTRSLVLYLQQAGRPMRGSAGRHPVILDHARLLENFGLPHADRPWQLCVSGQPDEVMHAGKVKKCPRCGQMVAASTKICKCGHVFRSEERELPHHAPGALAEYTLDERTALAERIRSSGLYTEKQAAAAIEMWSGYRTPGSPFYEHKTGAPLPRILPLAPVRSS